MTGEVSGRGGRRGRLPGNVQTGARCSELGEASSRQPLCSARLPDEVFRGEQWAPASGWGPPRTRAVQPGPPAAAARPGRVLGVRALWLSRPWLTGSSSRTGGAGTSPALNQPPRDPEARLLSARKAHEGGRGAGPSLPPRAAGRQQHSPTPVQAKGPRPPGLGAGRWRGVGGAARLPSSCLGRGSGPRALTESSLRTHRCAGAS